MRIRPYLFTLGLILAATVHAHRLSVSWEFADGVLTVLGRTESTPAAGAEVELRDAAGTVLTSGVLDTAGRFQVRVEPGWGDLTLVVNAGPGHRRTLVIPKAGLLSPPRPGHGPLPAEGGREVAMREPAARGGTSDGTEPLAVRVLLGLTFLLAAAAAWMGHCNRRRLAALEQRFRSHEGRS